MKPLIFIIFLFLTNTLLAANITAVQNGNWTTASTWDVNRAPADGDDITIPAGITVMFVNTPYPQSNPSVRPTFTIRIYGTLDFSSPGNDKLYLDVGSKIQIYAGGSLITTTSSTEIIAIYNGVFDNTVWIGTPNTINGPAYATATTAGFVNGLLPIKLESFNIRKDGEGIATLSWTTSEETRSSYFEIESLQANQSSWHQIGEVQAAGTSHTDINYSFSVTLTKGWNQFRLKEVDTDGKFSYSQIVAISYDIDEDVTFNYNPNTKQLLFNNASGQTIDLAIFDMSGQVVTKQKVTTSFPFSPNVEGMYIVRISNGHSFYSKKIYAR